MRNGYFPVSTISDSTADKFLWFSLAAWIISSFVPAVGMLLQFPVIAYLTWKADIKGIPALLMLMLGRNNIRYFDMGGQVALRLGITISPAVMFLFVAFLVAVKVLMARRCDGGSIAFFIIWMFAGIPATIMSYEAKINGLSGYWSAPIIDFLVPSVYFWGLMVSRSYEAGKDYFVTRLLMVLVAIEALQMVRIVTIFTFIASGLIVSIFFYFARDSRRVGNGWKTFAFIGIVVSLLLMVFGRKMDLVQSQGASELASADEYGSTFSRMAVYALVFLFVFWFKHRSSLNRLLPILIVVANLSFVSFAINTQQNANTKRDVSFQYETMEERFNAKLFGDRAGVWTMGWEEVKTPPYFIKDMRSFLSFSKKEGYGMKLLPHNQFLTLLGRHGWWLGLTLALFIIWVWMRAMKAIYYCMDDPLLYTVFVPTGLAIYAVVGTTGQAVVGSSLWANSLACIIMPAIIYGVWQDRRKVGMFR